MTPSLSSRGLQDKRNPRFTRLQRVAALSHGDRLASPRPCSIRRSLVLRRRGIHRLQYILGDRRREDQCPPRSSLSRRRRLAQDRRSVLRRIEQLHPGLNW